MHDDITTSTAADDRFEHALAKLLQAEEGGEPRPAGPDCCNSLLGATSTR
jgi:hypothetical protein